jgi:cytochrome P450
MNNPDTEKATGCPVDHTGAKTAAPAATKAAPTTGCPVDHSAPQAKSAVPAATLEGPKAPGPIQALRLFASPPNFMTKCQQRYGGKFRLKIVPGATIYVLTDPDEVKTMFLAPRDVLHTGTSSAQIAKFTGQTGLAWMDEEAHTQRRKSLMPSLKGGALQRIEPAITAMAEQCVAEWPRDRVVSLHPYVHRFTMQVIREVVFGEMVPSNWDEMFEQLFRMLEYNRRKASLILLHKLSPKALKRLRAIKPLGVDDFIRARERVDVLISEAIKERLESGVSGDDMLSVMLGVTKEDGSQLTGVELRDEMMTMFLAGTETTAAGICWTLEYLTREPEVLRKVLAEIDEGTGDTYLNAVVHEVLRLRPPTPQIIPREVMKPIEVGGVQYGPGMHLWASGYLLNRDPDRYPEPDEFRPERFVGRKPGAHTWIPFGGGHTRCLGDRIAIMEMKVVVRELLATCELRRESPKPEAPRSRSVVIVPEHGMRLELRRRDVKGGLAVSS